MVIFIICLVAAVLCWALCANSSDFSRYEEQTELEHLAKARQRLRESISQVR